MTDKAKLDQIAAKCARGMLGTLYAPGDEADIRAALDEALALPVTEEPVAWRHQMIEGTGNLWFYSDNPKPQEAICEPLYALAAQPDGRTE